MVTVYRITALWSGFAGAPGYSKFSFLDLTDDTKRNAAGAAIRTFFASINTYIPNLTTIQVQPGIDEFNVTTGELVGANAMTVTPAVVTSGISAVPYVGGAGLAVTWVTSSIFHGHRVRGRTFIVPTASASDTDGTIAPGVVTAVQAAGNVFAASASADLQIWSRVYTKPPAKLEQIDGATAPVISCVVKDMAAQLRSRRT